MLNKKATLLMIILNIICLSAGCAKKDDTSEPSESNSSDQELLQTALDNFNAEKKRGTTTVYTTTYEDGSTSSETEDIFYDSANNLIHTSYIVSEEDTQETFLVKEDEEVYCYEKDTSYENGWVRYLDLPDEDNNTSFDYTLAEFDYSFTEENGYKNVSISNEGNETLNGVNAVKLKVTATPDYLEDEDGDTYYANKNGSVKRQDILDEFGWSEECVNAVDGFSDIIDQYVDYLNESNTHTETASDSAEEYTIWIAADTTCILQLQSEISLEDISADSSSDIETEFWNNSWKADWIQSDLDDGLTVEEAKEILELEGESVAEQIAAENEDDTDEVSESDSPALKTTYIITFLTGEYCPDTPALPSTYTETTYEDYYNEYEEYEE